MGEILALLTALFWSIGVILFKRASLHFSAFSLNLLKNLFGLVLLVITLGILVFVFPEQWPDAPPAVYLKIIVSGALGIGIADTLFFAGLKKLSASRMALVETLYSPSVIGVSLVLLSEQIFLGHILGGTLIILSLLLSLDRDEEKGEKDIVRGILLGCASIFVMAVAIVWIKIELESYPLLWSTTIRLLGGVLLLLLGAPFFRSGREGLVGIFRAEAGYSDALWGAFMGTYLALICWLGGFKYADASVAALLNQCSTVFTVILAAFWLKEKISPRKWVAAGLAMLGAVLVIVANSISF